VFRRPLDGRANPAMPSQHVAVVVGFRVRQILVSLRRLFWLLAVNALAARP